MKKFHVEAAQRLLRAVLVQAIEDAGNPNADPEDRVDALDFLFSERSDMFVMAQGISDVDAFRAGMRQRMAAPVVTINVEGGKHCMTFTQDQQAA